MGSPACQALAPRTLERRAKELGRLVSPCRLCPHACGVDRARGEKGSCRLGDMAIVASASPHFGEERPISGSRGSGTIFFGSCNLACVFCQNAGISHSTQGERVGPRVLAELMLRLQDLGCHNINLVTPTHVTHVVAAAIADTARRGLAIPIVYNCGGYESVETLRLLESIVDIYARWETCAWMNGGSPPAGSLSGIS